MLEQKYFHIFILIHLSWVPLRRSIETSKIFIYFEIQFWQSYEDNEEIMSMTQQNNETEFQPIEQQQQIETSATTSPTSVRNSSIELQSEATAQNESTEIPVLKQNSVRVAKPSTPIPKSFCSIDNSDEDDDDDFNPFKVSDSLFQLNLILSIADDPTLI